MIEERLESLIEMYTIEIEDYRYSQKHELHYHRYEVHERRRLSRARTRGNP